MKGLDWHIYAAIECSAMKKTFATLWGCFLLIVGHTQPVAGSLSIAHFNRSDGLPEAGIEQVDCSPRGIIWLSTDEHIVRYNGYSFEKFTWHQLGLPSNGKIRFVPIDDDRVLTYSRNQSQLEALNMLNSVDGSFQPFFKAFPDAPFSLEEIMPYIIRDADYQLYFPIRNKGLCRLSGNNFEWIIERPFRNGPVHFEEAGDIQFITTREEVFYRNKRTREEGSWELDRHIVDADIWNQELILTVSLKEGRALELFRLAPGMAKARVLKVPVSLPVYHSHEPKDIFVSPAKIGPLVFGQERGVILHDEGPAFFNYQEWFGREGIGRLASCVSAAGALWVGESEGLHRLNFSPGHVQSFLEGKSIRGMYVLPDGQIWVNTYEGVFLVSRNGQTPTYQVSEKNDCIQVIDFGRDNQLWVTAHNGVWMADPLRGLHDQFENINAGVIPVWCMAVHPATGRKWGGGLNGLVGVEAESRQLVATNILQSFTGEEVVNVHCFLPFGESLFIGTNRGIFRMNEEEELSDWIKQEDGLLFEKVLHMREGSDGYIWLATDQGLIAWDPAENTFKLYQKESFGLSSDYVYFTVEDAQGFIWVATHAGLNRINPATGYVQIFGMDHGLPDLEFNSYAFTTEPDGSLLFGTLKGGIRIDPQAIPLLPDQGPGVRLRRVFQIDPRDPASTQQPAAITDGNTLRLPGKNNHTRLEFETPDGNARTARQYQYRLVGLHDAFQTFDGPVLELINLPRGNYELDVRIQHLNGAWARLAEPILLSVDGSSYIRSSFFWLVLAGSSTLLILALVFGFRFREKANQEVLSDSNTIVWPEDLILAGEPAGQQDPNVEWMEEIHQIIQENADNPRFNVGFLADKLGMSQRQLLRRIKELTGKKVSDLIREVRLEKASKMLASHEYDHQTIREIAHQVGFSSQDYFSRLFKEIYRCTPSEFRKQSSSSAR